VKLHSLAFRRELSIEPSEKLYALGGVVITAFKFSGPSTEESTSTRHDRSGRSWLRGIPARKSIGAGEESEQE
jgi:hypothetical protein